MQNFNAAELRPVERARAYLLKKMLKKPLREDAGADVLRDSPCSAHISKKLLISPARINHRCLSLPPLIGVHEHVLECVLEREFEKSLFFLPVICMQDSTGTYSRAWDPHRSSRRTSEVHQQHAPQPPSEVAHDGVLRAKYSGTTDRYCTCLSQNFDSGSADTLVAPAVFMFKRVRAARSSVASRAVVVRTRPRAVHCP